MLSSIVNGKNICPIDGTETGTTNPYQSEPGIKGVLHIPKSSINRASPSDGLVSKHFRQFLPLFRDVVGVFFSLKMTELYVLCYKCVIIQILIIFIRLFRFSSDCMSPVWSLTKSRWTFNGKQGITWSRYLHLTELIGVLHVPKRTAGSLTSSIPSRGNCTAAFRWCIRSSAVAFSARIRTQYHWHPTLWSFIRLF